MELNQLIENQLTIFCKENQGTQIAEKCETEDGFEEIHSRVKEVLETHFKNQEITVEDACYWMEQNDFETE